MRDGFKVGVKSESSRSFAQRHLLPARIRIAPPQPDRLALESLFYLNGFHAGVFPGFGIASACLFTVKAGGEPAPSKRSLHDASRL